MKLEFSQQFFFFSKSAQISNSMQSHPVGAELSLAGRQKERRADMTKLIVAFRNFANAPKKKRKNVDLIKQNVALGLSPNGHVRCYGAGDTVVTKQGRSIKTTGKITTFKHS